MAPCFEIAKRNAKSTLEEHGEADLAEEGILLGEPILAALNKPAPAELLRPIAAAFGAGLVLIAVFAGVSLIPLATDAPARLALSGQTRRRDSTIILMIGLAVLSTGSASLGFVAAQFSLEAHRGAALDLDDDRTWRIGSYDRTVIGRVVEAAERSPFVDGYAVLNWHPFSDTSLNMPVAMEGGPLVQSSVLTGETSWPHFVDANILAGSVTERLWGAHVAVAAAELRRADLTPLPRPRVPARALAARAVC